MTQSFQQLLVTNYGLLPSGYTGSQGIQGIPGTSDSMPKITAIAVTDSSYTALDDTAVDVAGGYVQLTGTGFASGCVVMINNVPATSTTFVGSTQVRAQLPATAAGTYVVYLVNADGGVAIRINGITFSATPAWTTASALPGTADGTAISIQLAATGADTYALAAGSTLPGTVTLTSGGLLSGVVSGLENETTYSFTVVATDAELQDSPRTFSITITAGDAYFNSTTLLLSGTADTFVRDASTNNLLVTTAGDVRPSNLSPFTPNYSNFFNGSSEYLTVPYTAQFLPGSGDFTFEAWTYVTSTANGNATLAGVWKLSGGQAWQLMVTGSLVTLRYNADQSISTATGSAPANRWNHIAWVKNGSTNTIYINGVASATATAATINNSAEPLAIGFNLDNAPSSWYFPGYVSNLRIVKGTAVYTANFVPTTDSLPVIAGTSLLTCRSNSAFVDLSANAFPVSRVGSVTISPFYPVQQAVGSSAYFDGTGDSLGVAATAPVLLNGDYTVEAWIWLDVNNLEYPYVFSSGVFYIRFGNSGFGWKLQTATVDSGVATVYSCPVTQTDAFRRWTHVALTRQSGVNRLFVNGVQQNLNTGANPGTYPLTSWTDSTQVGGSTWSVGAAWNGNISNFRVVKGTALYTTTFTVPASALAAVAGTSLLTLQNNTPVNNSTFLDSSSINSLVTRAGNTTQGTFSPYSPSGWSNYFDGTGDFLTTPNSTAFVFGTENYTIECWAYTLTTSEQYFYARTASNGLGTILGINSSGKWVGTCSVNGTANITAASSANATANTWTHLAITRNSTTFTLWVNGVSVSTGSVSGSLHDPASTVYIGQAFPGVNYGQVNGYISNLRVVKGTAVYAAAFTPPTQPLTALPGTSLLTCADNRFIDDSANNSAITRAGDTRVTNFSPFKAVTQTPQTYSAYFDGAGDYITPAADAAFTLGTEDFTYECWVNRQGVNPVNASYVMTVFDTRTAEPSITPCLFWESNAMKYYVNGANRIVSTSTFLIGTWAHVAIVRSAGVTKMYVNGVQEGSNYTDANNYVGTTTRIGGRFAAVSGDFRSWFGYISNARIVKGTAVYTEDFTPATTPLAAVVGTSLLTCQSPTFVDNSANRFAITAAGNTQPTTVNPFGFTFANSTGYTAAEYGGTVYFSNKTDYLAVPANTGLTTFAGNFTLECWVYPTNAAITQWGIWDARQAGATASPMIFKLGPLASPVSGSYRPVYYNGTENFGTGTLTVNQWSHVAFVRVGTTLTFYINGVAGGTATVSGTQTASATTNPIYVGNKDSGISEYGTVGYISNFRINNGTALYTSNFVPPAAPVQPVPGTVLLLNGTGAAITDATTKTVVETAGDVKISTAISKFGGSSMSFDGTGDYLLAASGPLLEFGSNDFTIEFWWYRTAGGRQALYHGSWGTDWSLGIDFSSVSPNNSNTIGIWASSNGTTWNLINSDGGGNGIGTIEVAQNAWTHIAFVRSGTTWMSFVNGVRDRNLTGIGGSVVNRAASSKAIGAWFSDAAMAKAAGYLQDLRITRGTARYTANFTPPTGAFVTK